MHELDGPVEFPFYLDTGLQVLRTMKGASLPCRSIKSFFVIEKVGFLLLLQFASFLRKLFSFDHISYNKNHAIEACAQLNHVLLVSLELSPLLVCEFVESQFVKDASDRVQISSPLNGRPTQSSRVN